ncbi:hypothetical protein D9M71_713270 [compost metagenome]
MHRAAGDAVVLHVRLDVGVENIHHALARRIVQVSNLFQPRLAGQHLVGDIQRQVSQLDPAFEHHFGSVGIGEQVELGHRRDIAAIEVGAAHDDHFLDAVDDLWRLDQRQSQVGLRAEHGHGDAVRLGTAQGVDQVAHRIAVGQSLLRLADRHSG